MVLTALQELCIAAWRECQKISFCFKKRNTQSGLPQSVVLIPAVTIFQQESQMSIDFHSLSVPHQRSKLSSISDATIGVSCLKFRVICWRSTSHTNVSSAGFLSQATHLVWLVSCWVIRISKSVSGRVYSLLIRRTGIIVIGPRSKVGSM